MYSLIKKYFTPNQYGALLIIVMGLASAISNSLTHYLSKIYPSFQILFLKALVALLILVSFQAKKLKPLIKSHCITWHFVRSGCALLGSFYWIVALRDLSMPFSTSLALSSALFTTIGGGLIFGEKIGRLRWAVLFFGFLGVYLILEPHNQTLSYTILTPLLSAVFFSCSSLIAKHTGKKDSSLTALFYMLCFLCLLTLHQCYYCWTLPSALDYVLLLLIGLFYMVNIFAVTEAYGVAEASFIAPFKFAKFPLNVLASIFFFFEFPTLKTIAGAFIIIGSISTLLYFDRKRKRLSRS